MKIRAPYRKLLGNGKAALLASIEIYNKPRIDYRDECFVILLLNAWELILKALLSKHKQPIHYPKKRNQPYRTYALADVLAKVDGLIPDQLVRQAIRANLNILTTYRENAVHFYNEPHFGSLIYALAQTSIVNLKDLLRLAFNVDLSEEITWHLLPLGLHAPIDPIEYIAKKKATSNTKGAVRQFIAQIADSTQSLQALNLDTGRLLTIFSVKLESTKKIANSDVVVGIAAGADASAGPLIVTKTLDPNISHPLKTGELITRVGDLHGKRFTSNTFQAIAWKHGLKEKPLMCWKASGGGLVKYSHDAITFITRLTAGDVALAVNEYRNRSQKKPSTPATASLFGDTAVSVA